MSIIQIRFDSARIHANRKAAGLLVLALLVSGTSFAAPGTKAASGSAEANANYQAERAVCNSGQSNQSRETCLQEAGAALKESRMGHLNGDQDAYAQNALIRCNAVPPDDRDACQRRIKGEGTTSGSVRDGGLVREIVVPDNK